MNAQSLSTGKLIPPRYGKSEAELEREALEWCERMGRKMSQKKSRNRPYGGRDEDRN